MVAGRDRTANGTWLGLNRHGMMAAILNRHGTLGPAAGKRSRGELPLLALAQSNLDQAAAQIQKLDAGQYRSFTDIAICIVVGDSEVIYHILFSRPIIDKVVEVQRHICCSRMD